MFHPYSSNNLTRLLNLYQINCLHLFTPRRLCFKISKSFRHLLYKKHYYLLQIMPIH